MRPPESDKLATTVSELLVQGHRAGLYPSGDGWIRIDHLTLAVCRLSARPVTERQVLAIAQQRPLIEVHRGYLRATQRRPSLHLPDILFAPIPGLARPLVAHGSRLDGDQHGRVRLVDSADAAWTLAHQHLDDPDVLVVDARRAQRAGVRIEGHESPGTYTSTPIPHRFILDLSDAYGEQHAAGGLPVRRAPDGSLQVLLVEIQRRSGVTWEVAKGKLERGESPEQTAAREIAEETGLTNPLRPLRKIDEIRYGFMAPGGRPRLKTVYLYLMEVLGPEPTFQPHAEGEGIQRVRWFSPEEATRAVEHPSLVPAVFRARDLLLRYGTEPDTSSPPLTPRT